MSAILHTTPEMHVLTHLPLDKMAIISQMIFSYAFSWTDEKFYILIIISLKFVHKGPIDNDPALV